MKKRSKFEKFVKNSWTNMNIRAGKYKHLQTKNKCKSYAGIKIEFNREEFKKWCHKYKDLIESLDRPSIDRIDSHGNYKLNNMQIIELKYNIRKDKTVFSDTHGICFRCKNKLPLDVFVKDKRRLNGLTNICRPCERVRK